MEKFICKVNEIFENYESKDYKTLDETLNELLKNGYPNGCFQDYTVLTDLISILTTFINAVKRKNGGETV